LSKTDSFQTPKEYPRAMSSVSPEISILMLSVEIRIAESET
jgi:hypothetical protein